MDIARLRQRVWTSAPDVLGLNGVGAPHRSRTTIGPLTCVDLGVPHAWGVSATAGDMVPEPGHARQAQAWLAGRAGPSGWTVEVPDHLVGTWAWSGLAVADRKEVYAMAAGAASDVPVSIPTELVVDDRPTHAEVVAAYGGWMEDLPLAERLVVPADLELPSRRFLVGRVAGRPVACAFVWWAAGTGYLSGIGVRPGLRGRGYGRALTAAAARLAAAGGARSPDIVWMHATDDGAGLYSRMGFVHVGTAVSLGPARLA